MAIALIAHNWLERKVERCGHAMEDAVTLVFTRNLQTAAGSPQRNPEQAVVVRPDAGVLLQPLVDVLDRLSAAGVSSITLPVAFSLR